MARPIIARCLFAIAILGVFASAAVADVNDLLSRIPPGANAVGIIDVDGVVTSPLGLKNDWKKKLSNAYAAKPLIVPPDAKKLVYASWIEPTTMTPVWEASVIELSNAPSMERIAKKERGFVDTIGDKQAAWAPINAYFVRLDTRLLGALTPADRQFTTRWAQLSGSRGELVSPYLQAAVNGIDPKTDYLFAFDLSNAVAAKRARMRLMSGEFESLIGKPFNVSKVCDTIASIKGVTLQVDVDDQATGRCSVDFGKPASGLGDIAKPLLLEMAGRVGASIDDFDGWKATTKDNSVVLAGNISNDGLRRLFSIVDPPSPRGTGAADEPAASNSKGSGDAVPAGPTATASKQYYDAVSGIIDNIGTLIRRAPSMTQSGTYIGRDARRIDRLPIMNVDPELLNWGQFVSGQMMNLASVCTTGGLNARSTTLGILDPSVSEYDTDMGAEAIDPNDGINAINVTRERRAALADAKAKTAQSASGILSQIEGSRGQIRIAMTQRYKTDF